MWEYKREGEKIENYFKEKEKEAKKAILISQILLMN